MKNKAVVPMVGIGVTALLAGGMGGYFTGKGVLESGGRKGFMAEEFCGGAFFGRDDSKEIADKFIPVSSFSENHPMISFELHTCPLSTSTCVQERDICQLYTDGPIPLMIGTPGFDDLT